MATITFPPIAADDWTDDAMFDGIKRFQKENRLKIDGLMRPGGPTETAINQRLSGGRGAINGIDASGLFNQFNGFAANADAPYGPQDHPRCRATGTCDIFF